MRRLPTQPACLAVLTGMLIVTCGYYAAAQDNFDDLAQTAKGSINAPGPKDLESRLAELQSAASRLSAYLQGPNGAAWKQYLKWNDLEQQLKAGSNANPAALDDVRRQFVANHRGLEMPVFANVAQALDRAVIALEAAQAKDFRGAVEGQIDQLSKNVQQHQQAPSEELASAIGTSAGWLQRTGQAGPLVQAVRQRFSSPNLYVRVSEGLVGAGVGRPIDDVGPVHDNILGTDVHGTAHTVGVLTVRLVPNKQRASFETILTGNVYSQTVGYNGPATICSLGTTCIYGKKPLALDSSGLTGYAPTANASTHTTITGVSAGGPGVFGRVIQNVATKQVYKNKSAAEAEASRKAQARVRRRVEQEAVGSIAQTNADFQNKFRLPLVRRSAYPGTLHFQTSDDYLYATAVQATRDQLAASEGPPLLQGPSDLSVQVHETLANNVAASLLGGRTLTQEQVNKRLIDAYGKLPEEMQSDDDQEPWTITFADARPVTLRLNDSGLQVTIRGKHFTSGDREFKAMNITADYKVELSDGQTRLTRQGDLQIFPPNFVEGKDRFSTQETALRSILRRKFGKLFKEEVVSDGLKLQGRLKSAGKLKPVRLEIASGWFVAQWMLPASQPQPASTTTASVD